MSEKNAEWYIQALQGAAEANDRLTRSYLVATERAEAAEARLRLLEAHCAASEASAAEYDREHLARTGYVTVSEAYLTTEMIRSVLGAEPSERSADTDAAIRKILLAYNDGLATTEETIVAFDDILNGEVNPLLEENERLLAQWAEENRRREATEARLRLLETQCRAPRGKQGQE